MPVWFVITPVTRFFSSATRVLPVSDKKVWEDSFFLQSVAAIDFHDLTLDEFDKKNLSQTFTTFSI